MQHQPYDPTQQRRFRAPAPEAILNGMRRIISERTQWDELPEVGMLFSDAPDSVRLNVFPVNERAWARVGHDPGNLLRDMHRMLTAPRSSAEVEAADRVREGLPDTFCGMFVRSEAWGVPPHRMDEMARIRAAGGKVPDYESLPGRLEQRVGAAVDCQGRSYMAVQTRGRPGIRSGYEDGRGDYREGTEALTLWKLTRAFMTELADSIPDTIPSTFLNG